VGDENQVDSFDDLFEPFELEEGPPPPSATPPTPQPPPELDDQPVQMVSCPSCGTANPAYNRHCEACGARLSTAPLPVAPPPMIRATPGGRALGILVAVVLIVTLVALFMNIFGGSDDETPPVTVASTSAPATTVPPVVIDELQPQSAEASSELNSSFVAENLIDNNLATEWQDRSLSGRGATLTFRFAQPVAITQIEIYNLPDEDRFKRNHRIKGYRINVDDLSLEITGQLLDVNTRQVIEVASINTLVLELSVTSTWESEAVEGGLPFTELALADVRFFGRIAD
jgi:hypothetical protein